MSPALRFDERGLIPAIAQDALTGQVRMVAWMNPQALRRTLETGRATFFSRSRGQLWVKGETSGNALAVRAVYVDCDEDVLLLLVTPAGASCHTGAPSCFFRRLGPDGSEALSPAAPAPLLLELEAVIEARASADAAKSYTRTLLDGGAALLGAKLREEAGELAEALANETTLRVANEAADVLFHLLVALRSRSLTLGDVLQVLRQRAGTSGHAEKAARGRRPGAEG